MQIRLTTYNVHRFIGRDGYKSIERTNRVLQDINPDIVALQEVEYFTSPTELDALLLFPDRNYHMVLGPTMIKGDEHYGNVLLSRFPVTEKRSIDLSCPGREERGAIDVDLDCSGTKIRVIATHFGLAPYERREQANTLLGEIEHGSGNHDITLLMGDMNEWFLWGRTLQRIHAYFGSCPDRATYPARFPLFSLDRIWCHPPELITARKVHKSRLAKEASDHLPLSCILEI